MLHLPGPTKEDHALLADFADSFTKQILKIALASLDDPEVQRPSFMRAVPGHWSRTKQGGLKYTTTDGRSYQIVPEGKRENLLNALWKNPNVP